MADVEIRFADNPNDRGLIDSLEGNLPWSASPRARLLRLVSRP